MVYSNPFEYSNNINLNNLTTNLPSNEESSTLRAFFMSEMERLTTVKTITNMEWVKNKKGINIIYTYITWKYLINKLINHTDTQVLIHCPITAH